MDTIKTHIFQEQTLAAIDLLFNQTPLNSNSVVPPNFSRSKSVVYPSTHASSGGGSGPVLAVQTPRRSTGGFVKSFSSRQRSSTDPMIKPNQLVDKAGISLIIKQMKKLMIIYIQIVYLRLF